MKKELEYLISLDYSLSMLAKHYGIAKTSVRRLLDKHGLETTKLRRYRYGEQHHNYKGGISKYKRKANPEINKVI
jgi:hypothetical protein